MEWQTPAFVEIRMDAEVTAYQGEDDPGRDPIVEPAVEESEAAPTR